MRRCRFRALATSILFGVPTLAHGQKPADKFVLDYDVPESPGFIALGVTPANITRGGAAKPVVASLLSDVGRGKKLASGVAVDFAPYFVYYGRLRDINEYRHNRLKRWLANTLISIATVQDETDSNSLRFGVGTRITLFDNHDLLQDSALGADIDRALSAAAQAGEVGPDRVGAPIRVAALSEVYQRVRERVRTSKGGALSVGWGIAGLVRGAIVARDSLGRTRHRVWLSYRQTFSSGIDALGSAQWQQNDSATSNLRAGAALRVNSADASFAAELYYDTKPAGVGGSKLGAGANVEWRFTRGVGLIVSLSTAPTLVGADVVSRLKVRTSLRWGMHGDS